MHEKHPCPRCGREIDAVARICPYCNADVARMARAGATSAAASTSAAGSATSSSPRPAATAAPVRTKPRIATRTLVFIAAGTLLVLIIVIALIVGLAGGDDTPTQVAETTTTTTGAVPTTAGTPAPEYPQLTLGANDPTATVGRSVTTTPVAQPNVEIPQELQREDATALPSTEYSAILERSRAQERTQTRQSSGAVDPRSIVAPSPIPPAPRRAAPSRPPAQRTEPARESAAGSLTPPRPIDQPLPRFRSSELRESGTVRLRLTVGKDGRVKEVNLLQTLPGITPKLIQAVQRWRFKPAERNGVPVEGTFTTDIFFKSE